MLIVVFALGILISMSLFGVAFARVMSAAIAARLGQAAAVVMAIVYRPRCVLDGECLRRGSLRGFMTGVHDEGSPTRVHDEGSK